MSTDITIPKGWTVSPLKEVTEKIVDGSHNPPPKQESGFPMLSARNVDSEKINFEGFRYITKAAFDLERKRADLRPNDVLLTIVGTIGRAAVIPESAEPFALQRSVAMIRPKGLEPKFCMYQLLSERVQKWLRNSARGSAQQGVYLRTLGTLPMLVAPLGQQRRVVSEIEKQFTRLDAGIAALRRTQANLKRYRAAVLKAACEGRLVPTEAELAHPQSPKRGSIPRKNATTDFESGAMLLERSLTRRRNSWKGRGQYKEPSAPDSKILPVLPRDWSWATLDGLADIKGGITKDQNRKHTAPARSVPYLRVANVQRGYIDLTEVKEIVTTEDEIQELALKAGDILFNEGGDRDKLGRGWVWNGELPECIHQNHVFRARLYVSSINPKFVSWYANTFGQKFFFDEGKHTTNLASISMTKLKSLPIPLPPLAEQNRIVAEVERRLSVVEELETVVNANLQRATRLRQSILQQAFSGNI